MPHNVYLPACCQCWLENGTFLVGHNEHSPRCRHTPSGGTGGKPDGRTRCNRIIGKGETRTEAALQARQTLGMD